MTNPRITFLAGLVILTLLFSNRPEAQTPLGAEYVLTDFESIGTELDWYVVNDNVMGGRSEGGFLIDSGKLRFEGITNTTGGGFSSIRTETNKLNFANFRGLRLRVQGDGRDYTWRLYTNARWRGRPISYSAVFSTTANKMESICIPFAEFYPGFRGRKLSQPELDVKSIRSMGIMINDQQDGPFKLQVDSVIAY